MARIAFLGLGQMGLPMAERLLEAEHDLTVWNRTGERATPLEERGANVAPTPSEAAAGAEFAFTMLAGPDALEDVLFGPDGLAGALGAGQVLVDMSTVGPDVIRSVAARVPEGVTVVDAPVRGSVAQATDGTLIVMVGATDEDFERCRPILEPLGEVRHIGGPGSGAAMKLVVNAALGAAIVALGEALALGLGLGLEQGAVLDALAETAIAPAVQSKRSNIDLGQYPARFKLRLAAKDMRLVTEAADVAGLDLDAARATRAWLDRAVDRGAGDLDYGAVVAVILGEKPR